MGAIGGVVGAVATIGSSVAQASAQQSQARSQAQGVAQSAEQQKIRAEAERELDRIDTHRRQLFTNTMFEANEIGRRTEAIQASYDYQKGVQAVDRQQALSRGEIAKQLAASETGYQQSLTALDKYRSDLRRAAQNQRFQTSQLYEAERLAARGEYITSTVEAQLAAGQQRLGLESAYQESNQQYRQARNNLVKQAASASLQERAAIQQRIDELDQQQVAMSAAREAVAIQGGGLAAGSGGNVTQSALAVEQARSALSGNAAVQEMSDRELTEYLSQISVADLTGQMGMTQEELARQLGINAALEGERVTNAQTLFDLFMNAAPGLRDQALRIIDTNLERGQAAGDFQQQQLGAQQRINRRAARVGNRLTDIGAAQQRGALDLNRDATAYNLGQQRYFDQINRVFAKDALQANLAASNLARNAQVATANTQAAAAAGQVPGFLSLAGPGIAQGVAGLAQNFLSGPQTAPVFTAPVQPSPSSALGGFAGTAASGT